MKGMLVTICSISQIGKDYIADILKRELERQTGCKIATPIVYKTRGKRQDDPENVICVDKEGDIPKDFALRYIVHGEQVVAFSEGQIKKEINDGNIVILTCANPATAQKLKEDFGDDCVSVRVIGGYKDKANIAKTEAKRYGLDVTDEKVQNSAKARFENMNGLVGLLEDYEADYDLVNYWTINKYLASGPHSLNKDITELAGEIALRIEEKNSIEI